LLVTGVEMGGGACVSWFYRPLPVPGESGMA